LLVLYTMINQHDKVYIKKYYGNDLKVDKKNIYEIIGVLKTKNCMDDNTIYTYNIITKNREYYMEKVPWYKGIICCCY